MKMDTWKHVKIKFIDLKVQLTSNYPEEKTRSSENYLVIPLFSIKNGRVSCISAPLQFLTMFITLFKQRLGVLIMR